MDIKQANQLTAEEYALRAGVPVSQVTGTFGNFTIAPATTASPNALATPYVAPAMTLPSGPVPVDKLVEPIVPKVGETPAPTDFNAILKGVMASLPAPVDTTQNDLIQSKINELSGGLDMTGYQNEQTQNQGVVEKQKIVSDLTAQLNSMNAESMAKQEAAQNQPGVVASIGTAQAGYEERTRAIKALALSAQIQVAQGNLTFAQDQVNKMVELKYQSAKDQITAWTQAYEMNKDNMTRAETKQADAVKLAYDIYSKQIDTKIADEKQTKATLLSQMNQYPDAGITLNDTLESANTKITSKSQIYQNQIRLVDGGGGTKTGGSYESIAQEAIDAGATPQQALSEAIDVAASRGNTMSISEQNALYAQIVKMKKAPTSASPTPIVPVTPATPPPVVSPWDQLGSSSTWTPSGLPSTPLFSGGVANLAPSNIADWKTTQANLKKLFGG